MKRPIGITISAIFLGWLTISGFGNAWMIISDQSSETPKFIGVIAFLYGISALVSAIGLWGMRQWAIYAVRSWMGTCILFLIVFTTLSDNLILGGLPGALGFFVFITVLFWLFDRYVKSKINQTS
ncbi:MAG: DUF2127 domain-containing protein [Gammaproteobacteria bacterium]|nr:DUF2127 domain-containing protein [Gammaproteobacteria bacterium]